MQFRSLNFFKDFKHCSELSNLVCDFCSVKRLTPGCGYLPKSEIHCTSQGYWSTMATFLSGKRKWDGETMGKSCGSRDMLVLAYVSLQLKRQSH
jgi:hypothetical protein